MMLGMYVHMHWAYDHPYAARTWTIDDWSAFLSGLSSLGYDLVQIWPMMDTMPMPPTQSDRAHLEKLSHVIGTAHQMGMTVYIGATANSIGNENAAEYDFEDRPYFTAEKRIDPGNRDELERLINIRTTLLEPLSEADGFWIIDSDPGGFPGSPTADFVRLFLRHRELLNSINPAMRLIYWMWAGWTDAMRFGEDWTQNLQECWLDVLDGISVSDPEPWSVLACWKGHFAVIDRLGLTNRTIYFPYGTIEAEPSFPWTNLDPKILENNLHKIAAEDYPLGIMGNAQSHCLQLPHIYVFRHLATGGTTERIDLAAFADDILPGHGEKVARAWVSLSGENVEQLESSAAELREIPLNDRLPVGKLSGLCFNQTERLLTDLEAQIALKIDLLGLREALTNNDHLSVPIEKMVSSLKRWYQRHGFKDRYYGPFRELAHPVLTELSKRVKTGAKLSGALEDFDTAPRHGAFVRLLRALQTIK